MLELGIFAAVLLLVVFGLGFECSECGAHTGFAWPRSCPKGCDDETDGTEP